MLVRSFRDGSIMPVLDEASRDDGVSILSGSVVNLHQLRLSVSSCAKSKIP